MKMKIRVLFVAITGGIITSTTVNAIAIAIPYPTVPGPHGQSNLSTENVPLTQNERTGNLASSECFWSGTAPFCEGECPPGFVERDRDEVGDGQRCWTGTKAFCCKEDSQGVVAC